VTAGAAVAGSIVVQAVTVPSDDPRRSRWTARRISRGAGALVQAHGRPSGSRGTRTRSGHHRSATRHARRTTDTRGNSANLPLALPPRASLEAQLYARADRVSNEAAGA
jgi:hypothetical protein